MHYCCCCYAVITSASALIACVALWRVKLARPTEILCIFAPARRAKKNEKYPPAGTSYIPDFTFGKLFQFESKCLVSLSSCHDV